MGNYSPGHGLSPFQQIFRDTSDRRLRDGAQIILPAQRSRPHPTIAEALGIAPHTVQRLLNPYRERGWDGLQPRQAPRAKPERTAELAPVRQL